MPGTLLIGFRTASGGYTVVSAANPLPVTGGGGGGGSTSVTATAAAPTYVEGSTTNPLSVDLAGGLRVTGPLTDTQLRATAVPVSGPLTDTQLRATAVPVSAAALPLPAGAATAALQGVQGTGATYNPPAGGSGEIGYLSGIYAAAASAAPTITVDEACSYLDIAASQSNVAVGNANDLLDSLLITPATMDPGAVTIGDGATATVVKFAGGTGSVSTLIPFPIDMKNIAAVTNHRVTTGANVSVRAFYRSRT